MCIFAITLFFFFKSREGELVGNSWWGGQGVRIYGKYSRSVSISLISLLTLIYWLMTFPEWHTTDDREHEEAGGVCDRTMTPMRERTRQLAQICPFPPKWLSSDFITEVWTNHIMVLDQINRWSRIYSPLHRQSVLGLKSNTECIKTKTGSVCLFDVKFLQLWRNKHSFLRLSRFWAQHKCVLRKS